MTRRASALYAGRVAHVRTRPRRHKLKYRIFSLLLDLDEIDSQALRLRWFSRNCFNVFSFHDRDHGNGTDEPLRAQVERQMRAAGIVCDGGAIRLFAMPRVLGYAFNPLSVYFCHRRDGRLTAILYEVNNTFGQRHSYLLPVREDAAEPIRQQCRKRFYVSPFMDMDMNYAFCIEPPGERVAIRVTGSDADGPMIAATHTALRTELTDAALMRAFFLYPLLGFQVMAGIHWEAMKLWFKGIRLRKRPPPPEQPVTVVSARSLSEP